MFNSINMKHAYDVGLKKTKPINQYTLSGEFIKEWKSGAEIYTVLGLNYRNISKCCYGERKKSVWL